MLPEPLRQIPADQPVDKVSAGGASADGAHDTRASHAAPVMPRLSCRNCRPQRLCRHSRAQERYSRAQERYSRAQERSTVAREHTRRAGQKRHRPRETPPWSRNLAAVERRSSPKPRRDKMRGFKLPDARVMARDFDRQVAELQIKAAILNRFAALGTPQTQRAG